MILVIIPVIMLVIPLCNCSEAPSVPLARPCKPAETCSNPGANDSNKEAPKFLKIVTIGVAASPSLARDSVNLACASFAAKILAAFSSYFLDASS